jgi:hypothetical protein
MAVPLRPVAVLRRAGQASAVSAYREYPPATAVASAVACTWEGVAVWPRNMRLLPDGCLDLVWDGQRARAVRPAAGPVRRSIGETTHVIGVRIRPGWAAVILGMPARDLPSVADLADVWRPACARRLEAALAAAADQAQCRVIFTRAITGRLADSPGPHPGVLAAIRLLGDVHRNRWRCGEPHCPQHAPATPSIRRSCRPAAQDTADHPALPSFWRHEVVVSGGVAGEHNRTVRGVETVRDGRHRMTVAYRDSCDPAWCRRRR